MRNLTKTLAVVSILAPAGAYPLGIGDIKLHSALNQNFNAEIALVLSGEKPSDIQVNLAPPDKFNEAGVPWSYFLSKIRFETVVKPNGSVIIKLTSNEALKEPFLDLLLELSWPKGNLYREFTVLVDPPAVYKQATIPVLTSPEKYQSEEPQAITQRQPTSRKTQTHFATSGEYGPTRRNDTLWRVAEQVRRDDDVSVEQMMVALYQENPRAFYQENVNALLAGKTLKVPEREVILKLSRKQALAEFNRQTAVWKNRLASASAETAPVKEEGLDNQLTLAAPAEAVVAENAVIAPGNEKAATANAESEKTAQTVSGGDGISDADNAIQSKIAALEKQLAAMQQIIALKDQQIATLQNPAQAKPVVQSEPAQPESVAQNAQPVLSAQQPVKPETVIQYPPVKPEPAIKGQSAESPPVVQEQPVQPTPSVTKVVKPVAQTKPVVHPVVQPEVESSSGFYYPIVSGIGAAALSMLGWLWWRKRKVEEETNTESMFASSSIGKSFGSSKVSPDSTIKNVISPAESSFLSEFTATDFDPFDMDQGEIDPISEADVYLAYGRYQQAEELIRHAINDFPARDDCKLKLLEIFHATENKKAFEAYAGELAESGKKDDMQFWAKVTEIANEICPDSSLFSSEAVNFNPAINFSSNGATATLDKRIAEFKDTKHTEKHDNLNFSVTKGSITPDSKQKSNIAKDSVLDLDSTSFADKDDTVSDDQKNNTSIDFDLNLFAADRTAIKAANDDKSLAKDGRADIDLNILENISGYVAEKQINNDSIEFNISSNDAETKSDVIDLSSNDGYQSFDFSFDDTSDLNERDDTELVDDDFQFNFDLDSPLDDTDAEENGFGVSDLTDMDEFETKLDLARAYIDMGDADSAKDIVHEVLEKGTTEQQKIAQTLMVDL